MPTGSAPVASRCRLSRRTSRPPAPTPTRHRWTCARVRRVRTLKRRARSCAEAVDASGQHADSARARPHCARTVVHRFRLELPLVGAAARDAGRGGRPRRRRARSRGGRRAALPRVPSPAPVQRLLRPGVATHQSGGAAPAEQLADRAHDPEGARLPPRGRARSRLGSRTRATNPARRRSGSNIDRSVSAAIRTLRSSQSLQMKALGEDYSGRIAPSSSGARRNTQSARAAAREDQVVPREEQIEREARQRATGRDAARSSAAERERVECEPIASAGLAEEVVGVREEQRGASAGGHPPPLARTPRRRARRL